MQTTSKLSNTTGTRKLVELTGALGTARRSYQVAEGQSMCVCASPGVLFTSRFQLGGGGKIPVQEFARQTKILHFPPLPGNRDTCYWSQLSI